MSELQTHLAFLARHGWGALGAFCAFFIGAFSARVVVANNIRPLMAFPMWLVERLMVFIRRNPSILALGLLIFTFNGVAMFIYLLLGLIPYLPAVIAFLTGMNVAIGAIKGPEIMIRSAEDGGDSAPADQDETPQAPPKLNRLAVACSLVTLLLELPCFWLTIALAAGMNYWLGDVAAPRNLPDFQMRVVTYLKVILPLLAVSALAESYSVLRSVEPPAQGTGAR